MILFKHTCKIITSKQQQKKQANHSFIPNIQSLLNNSSNTIIKNIAQKKLRIFFSFILSLKYIPLGMFSKSPGFKVTQRDFLCEVTPPAPCIVSQIHVFYFPFHFQELLFNFIIFLICMKSVCGCNIRCKKKTKTGLLREVDFLSL